MKKYKWYRRLLRGYWYFTDLHGWVREEKIGLSDILIAEKYD